jgi:MinD-like ATPase involved in chromosome partitioning or flagellar assembly
MCRIVSFISCKGGVGKSSLILSLAVGLSEQRKKVCVVDGYFGINGISLMIENKFQNNEECNFDLKDYLIGNLTAEECLVEASNNLFFIKTNSSTFDYLSHYELIKFFIEELSFKFDFILIDVNSFSLKNSTMFFECSNETVIVLDDSEIAIRNSSKLIQKTFFYENIKSRNLIINKARIIGELNRQFLNEKDIEEILKIKVLFVFPKFYKYNIFELKNHRTKERKVLSKFVYAFESNQHVDCGLKLNYRGIGGFFKKKIYAKYE